MRTFQIFLRQFFGYVFAILGGLIFLAALAVVGTTLWPWFHGEPLTRQARVNLSTLGPICAALGAGIFAAGRYLLRRGAGQGDSAFSRAAGPRRRHAVFNVASNTFCWPLVAGLWFLVRDHPDTPATPGAAVAGALAVYAGYQLVICCHELGHLGAAALVGLELHTFQVGTGPRLFSRRLGSLLVEWRALIGGGFVRAGDGEERGWRWRRWLFVAGGPAVHGVVCLALGWWLWRHVGSPRGVGWRWLAIAWWGDAPAFFALWVLCLTGWLWLFSVLPRAARVDAMPLRTDGYWLLHIPRLPQAAVRQQVVASLAQSAQQCWARDLRDRAWERIRHLQARYPGDPSRAVMEGYFLTQEGRHADAAASYAQALGDDAATPLPTSKPMRHVLWTERFAALVRAGQPDAARAACTLALQEAATPADRAETLDGLATATLRPGMRTFLPHADGWSAEALVLEPDSITRAATRGTILADLGRCDEAEPLLHRVWADSRKDLDAALSAFALGLVARAHGQERELRHWRKRAQSFANIVPGWVNERIARELGPAVADTHSTPLPPAPA